VIPRCKHCDHAETWHKPDGSCNAAHFFHWPVPPPNTVPCECPGWELAETELPEVGDLTHIERACLPWRLERLTECGLDPDRHPTWTREEAITVAKDLGRQRFSMVVCMTCSGTAERHSTWEDDPASCLIRHAQPMTLRWRGRGDKDEERRRFADELRAIASLIEMHRGEFDGLIDNDLSARRRRSE